MNPKKAKLASLIAKLMKSNYFCFMVIEVLFISLRVD
jgi:hypothetical protein